MRFYALCVYVCVCAAMHSCVFLLSRTRKKYLFLFAFAVLAFVLRSTDMRVCVCVCECECVRDFFLYPLFTFWNNRDFIWLFIFLLYLMWLYRGQLACLFPRTRFRFLRLAAVVVLQ